MALKGTLRDFGISEILQLIGHQKKSGTLVVTGPQRVVTVLFHQGQIVETSLKPPLAEYDLGVMLSRAGLVHPAQLELAQKQAQETLQPLELILAKTKAVTEEDLREMKRLRNQEILYDLFLWKNGEYEFEAGPVNYLAKLVLPLPSEQVLMDGYRVKDEWPELAAKIPDLNLRFRRRAGDFSVSERLEPSEDRIYRLVDGRRTAQELAYLSRMGKFESIKCLARLLERGRIEAVRGIAASSAAPARDASRTPTLVAAGTLAVFLLLMLNGARLNLERRGWLKGIQLVDSSRVVLLMERQTERVENGLAVHRLCYGEWPEELAELVRKGICRPSDLRLPLRKVFSYQRTETGYWLDSPVRPTKEAQ